MPGLRITRCVRPPFIRRVKIGPSWPKVAARPVALLHGLRLALTRRYDAVHSHEEGGAHRHPDRVAAARAAPVRHALEPAAADRELRILEPRVALAPAGRPRTPDDPPLAGRHRDLPELEDTVQAVDPDVPTVLIENAPGSGDRPTPGTGDAVRAGARPGAGRAGRACTPGRSRRIRGSTCCTTAMRACVAPAARREAGARGRRRRRRSRPRAPSVQALGLGQAVIFTGQRPAEDIPAYLDAATVLVSPRSTGTNTPLKIYQYLRSGRPIVATRLRTHTQVLSDDTAFLAEPTPDGVCGRDSRGADPARPRRRDRRARAQRSPRRNTATRRSSPRRSRPSALLVDRSRPEAAGGVA